MIKRDRKIAKRHKKRERESGREREKERAGGWGGELCTIWVMVKRTFLLGVTLPLGPSVINPCPATLGGLCRSQRRCPGTLGEGLQERSFMNH